MIRLFSSSALVLTLSVAFACSSSSSDTTAPPETPDGGSVDPSLVDFTMFVFDQTDPKAIKPLEGASAFFDGADGTRVEATADAEGRVVFKGVSFKAGPGSATAYKSGFLISSLLAITPEVVAKLPPPPPEFPPVGGKLVFALSKIEGTPDTVKLSGNIASKTDSVNNVTLTSSPGRAVFQATTATYTLDVKKDTPLTVVAMEWAEVARTLRVYEETKLRFVKFDVPAQAADGTFDFDLATGTALTSKKVANVTLKVPDASNLGGTPGWQVQSLNGPGIFFLGSRSKITPPPEGGNTFTSEGEYVDSPVPGDEVITFAYFPGFDGESAIVQQPEPPTDGMTIEGYPFPSTPGNTSLGGEVPIGNIAPSAEVVALDIIKHEAQSRGGFIDTPAWGVQTLRGSGTPTTIKIPNLPDAARALLPDSLSARVGALGGSFSDKYPNIPRNVAFGKFFTVKK